MITTPRAAAAITHIRWRPQPDGTGRPRFDPGPQLRALGYASRDLRHADGRWFTFEEAAAESRRIAAEALQRKLARGEGRRLPRLAMPGTGKTLGQLCEEVFSLPEFAGREIIDGRKRRKGLAPKTVEGYRKSKNAVEQACTRLQAAASRANAPSLWDAPAAALSVKLAQALLDEVERHSGLHQARGVRAFLSQMWGRLAARQPGVAKLLWQEVERLPMAPGRVRAWTVDEFVVMVDTADHLSHWAPGEHDRPEMGDMMVLGALTALRQTDRLHLKASHDAGSHLVVTTSKTGTQVELLKTPLLIARLAAASERRRAWPVQPLKPWPHLVLDEQAKRPFHSSGDHYRHLFDRVRAAAARRLPSCAEIRDQDLRDTTQTWLHRAGVDGKIIALLAGHSPSTAAELQARHYIERDRRAADAGMAAIGKLLEGKL